MQIHISGILKVDVGRIELIIITCQSMIDEVTDLFNTNIHTVLIDMRFPSVFICICFSQRQVIITVGVINFQTVQRHDPFVVCTGTFFVITVLALVAMIFPRVTNQGCEI